VVKAQRSLPGAVLSSTLTAVATAHVEPAEPVPPTARRRPPAVTFVAALALVVGVYYLVHGSIALADAGGEDERLARTIFEVALGVLALVISFGAFFMLRWAWALFMSWAIIGLTMQIVRHFFYDDANYVGMAINTVVVFALTPRDTQIAFGVRPPENADLTRPTRNPIDRD
jgi:hypothetical protein